MSDKPRKKLPETRGTSPEELFVDSELAITKMLRNSKNIKKSKVQPRTSNLPRKLN